MYRIQKTVVRILDKSAHLVINVVEMHIFLKFIPLFHVLTHTILKSRRQTISKYEHYLTVL